MSGRGTNWDEDNDANSTVLTERLKKLSPRAWLGVAVAFTYLVMVQYLLDWRAVLAPLVKLELGLLVGSIGLLCLSYFLRTVRMYSYLRHLPNAVASLSDSSRALLRMLGVMLTHNLLNHVLPARAGEVSFPVLLKSHFGLPLPRGTAMLLWFRVMDLQVLAGGGVLVLALLADNPNAGAMLGNQLQSLGIGSAVLWLIVALIALAPTVLVLRRARLLAWVSQRTDRADPNRLFQLVAHGLTGLPNTSLEFWRGYFWTVVNWLVKIFAIAWLFAQLAGVDLVPAVLAVMGGELTAILPIHAPGGFGTYPAGVAAFAVSSEISFMKVLPAAALAHLTLFATALVSGLIGWLLLNLRAKS